VNTVDVFAWDLVEESTSRRYRIAVLDEYMITGVQALAHDRFTYKVYDYLTPGAARRQAVHQTWIVEQAGYVLGQEPVRWQTLNTPASEWIDLLGFDDFDQLFTDTICQGVKLGVSA